MYELLNIVVNRILIRKRGGDTGRARGRRQQAGSVGSMGGIAIAYRSRSRCGQVQYYFWTNFGFLWLSPHTETLPGSPSYYELPLVFQCRAPQHTQLSSHSFAEECSLTSFIYLVPRHKRLKLCSSHKAFLTLVGCYAGCYTALCPAYARRSICGINAPAAHLRSQRFECLLFRHVL